MDLLYRLTVQYCTVCTVTTVYTVLIWMELDKLLQRKLFILQKIFHLFPPGLEPGTLRVLGARDNHYTTETPYTRYIRFIILILYYALSAIKMP